MNDKEGRVFLNSGSHDPDPYGPSARWSSPLVLAAFIAFCLLVAVVDGLFTETSVHDWYPSLTKPPGTPPNWVFPLVWTALYVMIGIAGWRLWRRRAYPALRLWGWQLLVNALWNPVFFGLHQMGAALAIIIAMLIFIFRCIQRFKPVDPLAAGLFVPYAAWAGYAAYLNAALWRLN